jgi:hypothetical protein
MSGGSGLESDFRWSVCRRRTACSWAVRSVIEVLEVEGLWNEVEGPVARRLGRRRHRSATRVTTTSGAGDIARMARRVSAPDMPGSRPSSATVTSPWRARRWPPRQRSPLEWHSRTRGMRSSKLGPPHPNELLVLVAGSWWKRQRNFSRSAISRVQESLVKAFPGAPSDQSCADGTPN